MGAVPPDGYLGGNRSIRQVLASKLGIPADRVGDYVVIAQVNPPECDWDIIVGPDVPIAALPHLFRSMARQLDRRAGTLLS